MNEHRKRVRGLLARSSARRAVTVGAAVAGALGLSLIGAVPSGAQTIVTNAPTANSVIEGAGSATTYNMMQGFDTLFNQTPGCSITSSAVPGAPSKTSQQLDYSCETSTGTGAGAPASGTTLLQIDNSNSYLDNPFNDVALSEPPEGSSNGIAALENSQAGGTGTALTTQNVAAVNYPRSSRAAKSSDLQGLNFVSYAKDGVSWFHFTKTAATTPSAHVLTLSPAQLAGIYQGTIYDWAQVGASKSAPIVVFSAQEGSGTQSTFQTFLDNTIGGGSSFDPTAATNPVNCVDPVTAGTSATKASFPASTTLTGCLGPIDSFENQTATMLSATSSEDGSNVNPANNGIFFYSYGKYSAQCAGVKSKTQYFDKSPGPAPVIKTNADCGGAPLPPGYKTALGSVNGVALNPSTILATSGTEWPIDRFVYNVYSNGTDTTHPSQVATPATLNYVSEVGFLCKPQTTDASDGSTVTTNRIIDPATDTWYHTEIFNEILAQGFIPLTATAGATVGSITDGQPQSEGSNNAETLLAATPAGQAYLDVNESAYNSVAGTNFPTTNTSISSASNPLGYCTVVNTNSSGTA